MLRAAEIFIFLIIYTIAWFIPVSDGVYDFLSDQRIDQFDSTATAAGVTSANVTLIKDIYQDDTQTISIDSSLATDTPVFNTFNTTTRQLNFTGLTANASRDISVTYTVDALSGEVFISNIVDKTPYFWYMLLLCIPPIVVYAVWKRMKER